MRKFYETSGRLVFVHFFGEIEDTKNRFPNYLTFSNTNAPTGVILPHCVLQSKNELINRRKEVERRWI